MDVDWTKEFEKINIPHANEFVQQTLTDKRLKKVNEAFSKFYQINSSRKNVTKVTFADKVQTHYFENTNITKNQK